MQTQEFTDLVNEVAYAALKDNKTFERIAGELDINEDLLGHVLVTLGNDLEEQKS